MSITSSGISPDGAFPWFPLRRFTVDEYHRLGQTGVLTEEDCVEMLEGFIVLKMNRKPIHDAVVDLARETLERSLPHGWRIRVQSAITTSDSESEPDLAVVRGDARDYFATHPTPSDVALIVEVADSSVERDREKRRLYARAGIPSYWIINLVDSTVEVYSEPEAVGDPPHYRHENVIGPPGAIHLMIAADKVGSIDVVELLP